MLLSGVSSTSKTKSVPSGDFEVTAGCTIASSSQAARKYPTMLAGVPKNARRPPASSKRTLSNSLSTWAPGRCSEAMTIFSRASERSVSATCSESFEESPEIGSSKRNTSARLPRSMPRLSRLRSPPEMVFSPGDPTRRRAIDCRPSSASMLSTRRSCSASERAGRRIVTAWRRCSRTVSCGLSASSCGMCAMKGTSASRRS